MMAMRRQGKCREMKKKDEKGGKNQNNHPDGPRFKAEADRIIDLEE